jgi:hypothetical protein
LLIKSEERENGLDLLSLESSITMAYKTNDIKGKKKSPEEEEECPRGR